MPSKKQMIIVIGGNDAGLAAAGRVRRLATDAQVLVVERTAQVAYASCGLPLFIAGQVSDHAVRGMDSAGILTHRGIKVLTEHEVTEISVPDKHISVRHLADNSVQSFAYDKLILALGARPKAPSALQGMRNIFVLRSYADADRLHSFLRQENPHRCLIVGGGLIGLEMAEAFLRLGLQTRLVESTATLAGLPEAMTEKLLRHLREHGLEVHLNAGMNEWQKTTDRITGFRMDSIPTVQPVDLIFFATGVEPNTALARKINLRCGPSYSIHVNRYQQTSQSCIFAAGDCCDAPHLVSRKSSWLPFAGNAARQGKVAGENALGGTAQFPGALGTWLVRIFDLEIGQTGLNDREARAAGFSPQITDIQQHSQSEYVAGHSLIDMQIVWDSRSKRILGGTLIGGKGAGHRLNHLAIAVQARLSLKDLLHLDLGYTPAINHMMDPLHIAASVALKGKKEKR